MSEARKRLKSVKDILSRMKIVFSDYENGMAKLSNISKNENVQKIAKQRFEVDQLEEQLQDLNQELLNLDCVIKDFRTGLVDFVAVREGETVWLCYKRGEEELKYYHGWNAGFVGRQLIDFD